MLLIFREQVGHKFTSDIAVFLFRFLFGVSLDL